MKIHYADTWEERAESPWVPWLEGAYMGICGYGPLDEKGTRTKVERLVTCKSCRRALKARTRREEKAGVW